ncbi:MAG: hypothetical protein RMI34_03845 [Chloroherpetonaceae bacterium]|nr:hypothetical protein [Chloroherpetonaceae bacterium]MCS7211737.1 hypothetical protein [Chloroherpetonaceae bacterium]MDW8019192.1 hypothetical protein [Chloroherpetonaceae bacterium]
MKKQLWLLFGVLTLILGCQQKSNFEDFVRAEQQINERQQEILKQSEELNQLIREVNRRFPDKKISLDTALGFTKEQEALLLSMIQQEKDVSTKGLLQKILDSEKQIEELQQKIKEITDKLPAPHVVKKGETHRQIAMEYLMNVHKLDEKKAKELVDRVALVDAMEVGYNVWLYYNDGVFGTFVTQGEAKISPYKLSRLIRRRELERAREEGRQQALEEIRQAQQSPAPAFPDTGKQQ